MQLPVKLNFENLNSIADYHPRVRSDLDGA